MEPITEVDVMRFKTIWVAYDDETMELVEAFDDEVDSLLYNEAIGSARERAGRHGLVRELTIDVPASEVRASHVALDGEFNPDYAAVFLVLETFDDNKLWTVGATHFDPQEDDSDDLRAALHEICGWSESKNPTVHAVPVTVRQLRAALSPPVLNVSANPADENSKRTS